GLLGKCFQGQDEEENMVKRAFLFFILISISITLPAQAQDILIDHEGECGNFSISVNTSGFRKGKYDLKLEKIKPDEPLYVYYPSEGWKSAFFYLDNYIEIDSNESKNVEVKINSTKDIVLKGKLRNGSKKWESAIYNIEQYCEKKIEKEDKTVEPNISIDYEGHCRDYNITLEASNFGEGIYDVKLNVKDSQNSRSSGMVYKPSMGWKSSFYYIQDIFRIYNGTGNRTFKVKTNTEEDFILIGKIRNKTDGWKTKEYQITQYCSGNEDPRRIYVLLILLISILVIQVGIIAYIK
ncbi:MAG: hypothetical protein ABEK17_03045, partial [Candidatus Aenigmatarchaeota archaeon]